MFNIEAIKEVLESQGKLDFKPFHFDNAEQEYWAFRTSDNKFHICDNDLKEIDRYDLKNKSLFKSWRFCGYDQKILFVLERENDYLFFEEGVSVTNIQEEQPNNPIRNVWLINDWDGEIVAKELSGYSYIGEKWIILETTTIEISEKENRYWIPERKIVCYDPDDLFKEDKRDFFYCGSYYDYWDLFYCDGKYYIECRDLYGRDSNPHHFENLVIWFSGGEVLAIDLQNDNGLYRICVYNPAVEIPTLYDYYYGDKCLGSNEIETNFSLKESCLFANENVFVLSNFCPNKSSWITIDRYGKVGSEIRDKGGKIVSVNNDIIKLETSSWNNNEKKYDFYDCKGCCIAAGVNKKNIYVIVTKTYNPTLFYDDSGNNIITFKGVLNTQNHKLVVPIKYKNLEPFDAGNNFYAIIGEEYTDISDAKTIQYGLLYNGVLILPCNKVEIKSLSENLFVWREGDKFGLISNGKRCCECLYDSISIAKSIGRKKKYSQDRYFPASHNYREFFYALLQDGNHYGIFVPNWDMVIPPTFNNIIAFVEEKFFLADDKIYNIKDCDFIFVKDMSEYEYIGGLKNYHLFILKNGDRDSIVDYICLYLKNGELEDEVITDAEFNDEIEADRDYIIWSNYNPVFVLGDGNVFYSVKENVFYDDINTLASYPEPDTDEGNNFERDTYYALGGDDYDRWKENGGDIDGMMEGMGF